MKLKLEEKQFLFKKYVQLGYDREEASRRVKDFLYKINSLIYKLKMKKKSEEEINKKFKEEFERRCRILEAEMIDKKLRVPGKYGRSYVYY